MNKFAQSSLKKTVLFSIVFVGAIAVLLVLSSATENSLLGNVIFFGDKSHYDTYTLVNNFVIDKKGNILQEFPGGYVYLARDFFYSYDNGSLVKYNYDFTPVWKKKMLVHHELFVDTDGTILVASKEVHKYRDLDVEFDIIYHISDDGELLYNYSTWKELAYLQQFHHPPRVDHPNFSVNMERKQRRALHGDGDYYHINSIQEIPKNKLGKKDKRFQQGNWLISFNTINTVMILDKDTKKVTWTLENLTQRQHGPRMLANGNILLYDNGALGRKFSRILEIDPVKKQIVWEYNATVPESFYSWIRGFSQRLPNGNTLITESVHGTVFEVNKKGEIVWEWNNTVVVSDRYRHSIYRARRVDDRIMKEHFNIS